MVFCKLYNTTAPAANLQEKKRVKKTKFLIFKKKRTTHCYLYKIFCFSVLSTHHQESVVYYVKFHQCSMSSTLRSLHGRTLPPHPLLHHVSYLLN